MFPSSKIIKGLFYTNVIIFLIGLMLQAINFPFYELFALFPKEGFMPHQLITHQFLHGGFLHIIFNMLALISFGAYVEDFFGSKRFLIFYLLCGLGAAFLHIFMNNSSVPMVGASGAIFGVMIVYGIINPNEKIYLFGLIGSKAKYLISILFAIEIFLGFTSHGDGVAHYAHVGGGLTGILLYFVYKYLPKSKKVKRWS